jgi:protein OS-9
MRTHVVLSVVAMGVMPTFVMTMLHSIPEDPAAFPKYRVSFLNGLPVLNETAERWLADGLRGGEQEFLERPWDEKDSGWKAWLKSAKEIGSGDEQADIVELFMYGHNAGQ